MNTEKTRVPNYIEASITFENCKKKCCDTCTDETCLFKEKTISTPKQSTQHRELVSPGRMP